DSRLCYMFLGYRSVYNFLYPYKSVSLSTVCQSFCFFLRNSKLNKRFNSPFVSFPLLPNNNSYSVTSFFVDIFEYDFLLRNLILVYPFVNNLFFFYIHIIYLYSLFSFLQLF